MFRASKKSTNPHVIHGNACVVNTRRLKACGANDGIATFSSVHDHPSRSADRETYPKSLPTWLRLALRCGGEKFLPALLTFALFEGTATADRAKIPAAQVADAEANPKVGPAKIVRRANMKRLPVSRRSPLGGLLDSAQNGPAQIRRTLDRVASRDHLRFATPAAKLYAVDILEFLARAHAGELPPSMRERCASELATLRAASVSRDEETEDPFAGRGVVIASLDETKAILKAPPSPEFVTGATYVTYLRGVALSDILYAYWMSLSGTIPEGLDPKTPIGPDLTIGQYITENPVFKKVETTVRDRGGVCTVEKQMLKPGVFVKPHQSDHAVYAATIEDGFAALMTLHQSSATRKQWEDAGREIPMPMNLSTFGTIVHRVPGTDIYEFDSRCMFQGQDLTSWFHGFVRKGQLKEGVKEKENFARLCLGIAALRRDGKLPNWTLGPFDPVLAAIHAPSPAKDAPAPTKE